MNHSQLIRKLRIDRNLSQAKLANQISQRSTLSTFELNNSRISFELLSAYLNRMNISLEEYQYLADPKDKNDKRKLSIDISKKFDKKYDSSLSDHLLQQYKNTGDFFYYSLYAQYFLVCSFLDKNLTDRNKIKKIKRNVKSYLDNIDVWGRFELVLFTNCLFIFEDNYILFQFNEAIQHMKIYTDSANYSHDLIKFLVNGLHISYSRGTKENIAVFIDELKKVIFDYDDLKAKLIYEIFKLLIDRDNGVDNTKEKYELLLTLKLLKEPAWVEYIELFYK